MPTGMSLIGTHWPIAGALGVGKGPRRGDIRGVGLGVNAWDVMGETLQEADLYCSVNAGPAMDQDAALNSYR